MALDYNRNSPVRFLEGNQLKHNDKQGICSNLHMDFCQLAQQGDPLAWQTCLTPFSGQELVLNGDFGSATGWTVNPNWSISGGVATHAGASDLLRQQIPIINGRFYKISYKINSLTPAGLVNLRVKFGGNTIATDTTTGIKTLYRFASNITGHHIEFDSSFASFGAEIDDVSVIEISQLGFEIKDTFTGLQKFSDFTNTNLSYNNDKAQVDLAWDTGYNQLDQGCYEICAHDTAEHQEIIVNGEFIANYYWVLAGLVTLTPGTPGNVAFNVSSPGTGSLSQTFIHSLKGGKCYVLTYDVFGYVSGTINIILKDTNTTIGTITGDGSFSIDIDLTAQVIDETEIAFEADFADGADVASISNISIKLKSDCYEEDACSECYCLADNQACSILFSWTNTENAFGNDYETLGLVNHLRVLAKIQNPSYQKDKVVFNKSNQQKKLLTSRTDKVLELFLYRLPEYLHDAVAVAVEHDTFTVVDAFFEEYEGEYVNLEQDYEPQWEDNLRVADVRLQITRKVPEENRVNDLCE